MDSNQRNLSRLKGSQRVRLKPSVILGSDGIRGVQQTFFEIVSNSIDRWKEGYGKKIKITRHKDHSFTIVDEADGLPCEWNEKEHAYNWDIALKTLYGGDNYIQSEDITGKIGNFGLGLTSTMYSSKYMNVIIYKEDKKYTIKFKEGRPIHKDTGGFICEDDDFTLSKEDGLKPLLIEDNTESLSGTIINYKPDDSVFTDIQIPLEWLKNKLKRQTVVNNGLLIELNDEVTDNKFAYQYNNISEYIEELGDESKSISDIVSFEGKSEGRDNSKQDDYKVDYNVAFQFTNENNTQEYFHNSSELTELKHNVTTKAIEKSMTNSIHDYINENKLYNKNEKKIKFDDIKDSLICVLCSRSTKTSYSNQTKLSIDNPFIQDFITNDLKEKLKVYFIENKLIANQIINQCLINMRANSKAEKSKQELKKKLQGITNGKVKVDGLTDCDMRKSKLDDRWILIVEGKSPKATVVEAYDNTCMGALGLRGRFISCLKKSVTEVLNNTPAYTLIQALGCGIEIPLEERKKFKDIKSFNKENLRYGNIGILTDADCWGSGIRLALLTFIYKYLPTLLKENRVYIIISPRYEIKMKTGEMVYAYNDREKEELMKNIKEEDIYNIGIVKGLGEINKEDFWDKVLCPEAREKTFIQVNYDNIDEVVSKYFEDYMGEDTSPRKQFVKEFITNINLEDIN